MATINVKDAAGSTTSIEKPNSNGRAAAAASRPVALATEDKAALDALSTHAKQDTIIAAIATLQAALETIELGATTLAALENITATVTGVATAANQSTLIGHVDGVEGSLTSMVGALVGTEYEPVAASASTQALGATGATGDLLTGVLIIPATTSPGAVQIKDGAGSAITVFAGGADSVSTLHPFFVPLGIRSGAGAWQLTTGANVSAIGVGNFS